MGNALQDMAGGGVVRDREITARVYESKLQPKGQTAHCLFLLKFYLHTNTTLCLHTKTALLLDTTAELGGAATDAATTRAQNQPLGPL